MVAGNSPDWLPPGFTEKIKADALEALRRSLVHFRSQPVGTIAAYNHASEEVLNYDKADLKRADIAARLRAMVDSLMALEWIKNLQDRMANKTYRSKRDPIFTNEMSGDVTLANNRKLSTSLLEGYLQIVLMPSRKLIA